MSEAIEYWQLTKNQRIKQSREKKKGNSNSSSKMLTKNSMSFEVKNNGAHLVVAHNDKVADLWPGTGTFIIRGHNKRFRGVRLLIKILRGDYTDKQFNAIRPESKW